MEPTNTLNQSNAGVEKTRFFSNHFSRRLLKLSIILTVLFFVFLFLAVFITAAFFGAIPAMSMMPIIGLAVLISWVLTLVSAIGTSFSEKKKCLRIKTVTGFTLFGIEVTFLFGTLFLSL
jgi:uncharacterized membrane protein